MRLLPGDIVFLYRGTIWMLGAPFVWLYNVVFGGRWSWAYHVELCWEESTAEGYKALSMEPPVLNVADRMFDQVKIKAYRLKNRPKDIELLLAYNFNYKIGKSVYGLFDECPDIMEYFYRKEYGIKIGSTIPEIEHFCSNSRLFVEVK